MERSIAASIVSALSTRIAVRGSFGQERESKRERLPGWQRIPSAGAFGVVFRILGRRAFVSAAVWASITLRVDLRLGGGWVRLERRSGWRLTRVFAESLSFWYKLATTAWALSDSRAVFEKYGGVVLSSPELCLGLKNDEVSLLW